MSLKNEDIFTSMYTDSFCLFVVFESIPKSVKYLLKSPDNMFAYCI